MLSDWSLCLPFLWWWAYIFLLLGLSVLCYPPSPVFFSCLCDEFDDGWERWFHPSFWFLWFRFELGISSGNVIIFNQWNSSWIYYHVFLERTFHQWNVNFSSSWMWWLCKPKASKLHASSSWLQSVFSTSLFAVGASQRATQIVFHWPDPAAQLLMGFWWKTLLNQISPVVFAFWIFWELCFKYMPAFDKLFIH